MEVDFDIISNMYHLYNALILFIISFSTQCRIFSLGEKVLKEVEGCGQTERFLGGFGGMPPQNLF